jgi:hypothetical protein
MAAWEADAGPLCQGYLPEHAAPLPTTESRPRRRGHGRNGPLPFREAAANVPPPSDAWARRFLHVCFKSLRRFLVSLSLVCRFLDLLCGGDSLAVGDTFAR